MDTNRSVHIVVRFDDGNTRQVPNLLLNFHGSWTDFKAHLETALRRSPADPYVALSNIEYRVPAQPGQPQDDSGWLLADDESEGKTSRRHNYIYAAVDETSFDATFFLGLSLVRLRANGRTEDPAAARIADLRRHTPRPAHTLQRIAHLDAKQQKAFPLPLPEPASKPAARKSHLASAATVAAKDEASDDGTVSVNSKGSNSGGDFDSGHLVSSPARRAAAIVVQEGQKGGREGSDDSHSLGSFDCGVGAGGPEDEEEDDWRVLVLGGAAASDDEREQAERACDGALAPARNIASSGLSPAPDGGQGTQNAAEAEAVRQRAAESAQKRVSRRMAFGFSRGRGRAGTAAEDSDTELPLPLPPQLLNEPEEEPGSAVDTAKSVALGSGSMPAPPVPPPQQQQQRQQPSALSAAIVASPPRRNKTARRFGKGKASPARVATTKAAGAAAVDSSRLPKGMGMSGKRLTPRVSEKPQWERSLRGNNLSSAPMSATASGSSRNGGGGGNRLRRVKKGKEGGGGCGGGSSTIIEDDSSQDGSIGGGGGDGGGAASGGRGGGWRTSTGRPATRVSVGTWDKTMRHLAILKEISGKDEEELEWLATAKQGDGLAMAERSQEREESEYHRLLHLEGGLSRDRDRLGDRRVETALRALAALAGPLDAANAAVVEAADEQSAMDAELAAAEEEALAFGIDVDADVSGTGEPPQNGLDASAAGAEAGAAAAQDDSGGGSSAAEATAAAAVAAAAARLRLAMALRRAAAAQKANSAATLKLDAVLVQSAAKKEAVGRLCDEAEQAKDSCAPLIRLLRRLCAAGRDDVAPRTAAAALRELRELQDEAAAALRENARALGVTFDRMEKWRTRKEALPEYEREMRRREERWFDDELARNHEALRAMRTLLPTGIAAITREQLEEQAMAAGSLYPRELAAHLKDGRMLHWCVLHADDIARSNFLVGQHAHCFTNLEKYDVTELRAVAACLPSRFELDRDGRKAAWRKDFVARLQALVAQERGEEVLASWDPEQSARRKVKLPDLPAEQKRRAMYYYPKPEEAEARLEKLKARDAGIAAKTAELAVLKEKSIPESQLEYAAVLADTREEYFRATYSPEELRGVRSEAKAAVDALKAKAKAMEQELQGAARAARSQLFTAESLAAEMDATRMIMERRRAAREKAAAQALEEHEEEIDILAALGEAAAATAAAAAAVAGGEAAKEDGTAAAEGKERKGAAPAAKDSATEAAAAEDAEEEDRSLWLVEGPFDPEVEILPKAEQRGSAAVARFAPPEEEAARRKEELQATLGNRRDGAGAAAAAAAALGSGSLSPPRSAMRSVAGGALSPIRCSGGEDSGASEPDTPQTLRHTASVAAASSATAAAVPPPGDDDDAEPAATKAVGGGGVSKTRAKLAGHFAALFAAQSAVLAGSSAPQVAAIKARRSNTQATDSSGSAAAPAAAVTAAPVSPPRAGAGRTVAQRLPPSTPPPPPRSKALATLLRRKQHGSAKTAAAAAVPGAGGPAPGGGPPMSLLSAIRERGGGGGKMGGAAANCLLAAIRGRTQQGATNAIAAAAAGATESGTAAAVAGEGAAAPAAKPAMSLLAAIRERAGQAEAAETTASFMPRERSLSPPPPRGGSVSPKRMSVDAAPAFGQMDEQEADAAAEILAAAAAVAAVSKGHKKTVPPAGGGGFPFAAELRAAALRKQRT